MIKYTPRAKNIEQRRILLSRLIFSRSLEIFKAIIIVTHYEQQKIQYV